MARIPEGEIDRLKKSVDLVALIQSKGIQLKKHGSKDLIGLCPFHNDKNNPNMIVTPEKNLFHCMHCGAAGSSIDFVMKYDGITFRHAVELLRDGKSGNSSGTTKRATIPLLDCPLDASASDHELYEQVIDYYHERFFLEPEALNYLKTRQISEEAVKHFKIGFADRTLGLRLPHKNRREGGILRNRLTNFGFYRESGHEHFTGGLTFPIRNIDGHVVEVYSRRIGKQKTGFTVFVAYRRTAVLRF